MHYTMPTEEDVIKTLGPYQFIKSLGKGGMGEVFLVYDRVCQRHVAFKQIKEDLLKYSKFKESFLCEARLAARLIHPSIIPIYSIHIKNDSIYYTMPYIEGQTLKQLLQETKKGEIEGKSMPQNASIFLKVCQGIAYAHSQGIIHRDIKPENILLGKYGEVLILDWGLAEEVEKISSKKIVGTLSHLAPELVQGKSASTASDIYALGVILYQMLTLQLPFRRENVEHFRKVAGKEQIPDPAQVAPYRDIPLALSRIVQKCLSLEERYTSVEALISDLENYIEGKPEWIPSGTLDINNKEDWELQENVLLTKHIAITRSTDVMEWVSLMISKKDFPNNLKVEGEVTLDEGSGGIGFLLKTTSEKFDQGYCVWVGSQHNPGCQLFRSNIEVHHNATCGLPIGKKCLITIEISDNTLTLYINGMLQYSYKTHQPLLGTKLGLLYRDTAFTLNSFKTYSGNHNVTVGCLSIPDAFLMNRNFDKALAEYRRIGNSFPGRAEGREAMFLAGLTLLTKGECDLAWNEFGLLRNTPGAPLEYLGKSLIHKMRKNVEEEIKCLELSLRRYPNHPLLPILEEHILFRLHEASHDNRKTAYHFALLALMHLPHLFNTPDNQKLLDSLERHLEPLWFIEPIENKNLSLSIQIAFWLAKPLTLFELYQKHPHDNILLALLTLRQGHLLNIDDPYYTAALKRKKPSPLDHPPNAFQKKILRYLAEEDPLQFPSASLEPHIKALLLSNQFDKAEELFNTLPQEELFDETSPLFSLYGCFIAATQGKNSALSHFSNPSEILYPPTPQLLCDYLHNLIDLNGPWGQGAFLYEKITLLRHLILFHHCTNEEDKKAYYQKKLISLLNTKK